MPSQGTSTFDLFALRFRFRARTPVRFPPGETANLFRGQFGKILYRRDPAIYARLFAPVAQGGPSGLHDPPRPFVLRVRHLDGAVLDDFHAGINLFETNRPDTGGIRSAIAELAQESLRAELTGVDGEEIRRLPFATTRRVDRVRVHFLSPTELKNAGSPEFGPLFARIRDRISTLREFYGSGPLEIDFKAMGERAAAIRMTCCELQHVDAERVSQGRRHPLGGFTGVAEYEGDLTEFIPYLEIASYTGVGRQTVWGKGEIAIETF
ncbi:MAG TPA: CRISPR system precrRNA processing endoribonuclease RAMP protein Cas6 [Bryobacteraceae bacterium]|nr:CRISPR system precrRNA processing endoribonuclease RAMP protein Cas6 [Bryobacteraceae bacterium]